MPINQDNIVKGKCYKNSANQHRRVYAVNGDQITYESWGGNVGNHRGHLSRTTVNRVTFANDVDEEIACPIDMNPLP